MTHATTGPAGLSSVAMNVDRLVHEPARLAIMTQLYPVDKADFLFLQRTTGLTKGNLSSHIGRLEGAGYVVVEKTYRGKTPLTLVALTSEGREAFDRYRRTLRGIARQLPE